MDIKPGNTPPERISSFREDYDMDQEALDRLLGFRSMGRTTRRWEREGAPPYVDVLLSYMSRYGIGEAERIAQLRDCETSPQSIRQRIVSKQPINREMTDRAT